MPGHRTCAIATRLDEWRVHCDTSVTRKTAEPSLVLPRWCCRLDGWRGEPSPARCRPSPRGLLAPGSELLEHADRPITRALDRVGWRLAVDHLAHHVGPEVRGLERSDPRIRRRR